MDEDGAEEVLDDGAKADQIEGLAKKVDELRLIGNDGGGVAQGTKASGAKAGAASAAGGDGGGGPGGDDAQVVDALHAREAEVGVLQARIRDLERDKEMAELKARVAMMEAEKAVAEKAAAEGFGGRLGRVSEAAEDDEARRRSSMRGKTASLRVGAM